VQNVNVICGTPRSGSTLFCNILRQNPRFHVSSTSPLCPVIGAMVHTWSNSLEVKSYLISDGKGFSDRLLASLRAVFTEWYSDTQEPVVFDKCRGWGERVDLLRRVHPESKIIAVIRHPVSVFASIEKQHRRTAELDSSPPGNHTTWARAEEAFSPTGMIGSTISATANIVYAGHNAIFVRYEDLVERPESMLGAVYDYLGEEPFEHDLGNVAPSSEEYDALYLFKFPHVGSGSVKQPDDDWRNYLSDKMGQEIAALRSVASFCELFGYKPLPQKMEPKVEKKEAREPCLPMLA
jgi:sulfotransferase